MNAFFHYAYDASMHNITDWKTPVEIGDMRMALRSHLLLSGTEEAALRNDFSVCHGAGKVGLARIGSLLEGFILKRRDDALTRLPQQVDILNQVFDRVTFVVGQRYPDHLPVPRWWGVMTVFRSSIGELHSRQVREASPNPHQDLRQVAALLWHQELTAECIDRQLRAVGTRAELADRLVSNVDPKELRRVVFSRLLKPERGS